MKRRAAKTADGSYFYWVYNDLVLKLHRCFRHYEVSSFLNTKFHHCPNSVQFFFFFFTFFLWGNMMIRKKEEEDEKKESCLCGDQPLNFPN